MIRDVDAIDCEVSLLATVRAATRTMGGNPSTDLADELLDGRNASHVVDGR